MAGATGMRRISALAAATLTAVLCVASFAHAQAVPTQAQANPPSQPQQQNGIKVGAARLHLGLELSSKYATNPSRQAADSQAVQTGSGVPSDVYLTLRPIAELE